MGERLEQDPRRGRRARLHAALDPLARLAELGPEALEPARIGELAHRHALAPSTLRGVASFFSDLRADPGAARICSGTACLLAGARPEPEQRRAYCLGFCDRGPARLHADGRVELAGGRVLPPGEDPGPELRCLAARPVVTRRLLAGAPCQGLVAAREAGAYRVLENALRGEPEAVLAAVERSGERGRGGAGYSTGAKWRACARAAGPPRFVVANGDEGDPGSFVDRILMERDPHGVLEGLALCGFAVGAERGFVFVRSEYPAAAQRVERAIEEAREAGLLGSRPGGFDVEVVRGRGSYVCGEETALLNALEGFRGEVRLRPPYPSEAGLRGHPTVVNNVETLVNVPTLVADPEGYARLGTQASSGTKALSLGSGFARPGIVEVELGTTLARVVEEAGGGADGRAILALLVGGPMGSVVPPEQWETPICYAALREQDISLGHGGLVALLEGADLAALLRHWLRFAADESCGRCAPCALGSERARRLVEGDGAWGPREAELRAALETMAAASLCAFGQLLPGPVLKLLELFGDRIEESPS